jgi:thiosulfate/3-mercaptopyruvate sulfurtransferase
MPGARNVPFGTLLNGDGTLKDPAGLRQAFESAGIDVGRPVVTTCGSGVSAAVLALALAVIGRNDTGLYDGSWSQWGQEKLGLPIAKGP